MSRKKLFIGLRLIFLIVISVNVINCDNSDVNEASQDEGKKLEAILNSGLALEHEIVEEQADQPAANSGENFVAIHVDALGAKENLNSSLKGLAFLANSFLPAGYKFLNVVSATREVVAGVKYDILVNSEDENGSPIYCFLIILEKPWITKENGDKYRSLEHSNCTSSVTTTEEVVSEIVTQVNPVFESSTELSEARIKDLEGQIIVQKQKVFEIPQTTTEFVFTFGEPTVEVSSTTTEATVPLSEGAKDSLDQIFTYGTFNEANNQQRVQTGVDTSNDNREEVQEEIIVPKKVVPVSSDATADSFWNSSAALDLEVQKSFEEVFKTHKEIQRVLDEIIQNGGGKDVQIKYEPVFSSLIEKVKAHIGNFYQSNNHRAVQPPTFYQAQVSKVIHYESPKIDAVVMQFNYNGDEDVQKTKTREELQKELNEDESEDRLKRHVSYSSEEYHHGHHHDSSESGSHEEYYRGFAGLPPVFFGRRKRAADEADLSRSKSMEESSSSESDETQPSPALSLAPETKVPVNPTAGARRRKREVISDKDNIMEILEEAVKQQDHVDDDDFRRVILEIGSVKKVNGNGDQKVFLVRLSLGSSHCIEGSTDDKKCKMSLIDGSTKYCTMEIRVKRDDVKLIKSECAPESKERSKRQIPGGHTEQTVTDEHHQLVHEGLTFYKARNPSYTINSVRTQVVAGTKYYIDLIINECDKCLLTVWERLWLNEPEKRQYKWECDDNQDARKRERREILVGGSKQIEDFNSPEHQERVLGGLKSYGSGSLVHAEILSAQKQLVSGMLYKYKLIARESKDSKDSTSCSMTVLEKVWLKGNDKRKYTTKCDDDDSVTMKRSRRQVGLAGGVTEYTPEQLKDPKHLERVNGGLKSYSGYRDNSGAIKILGGSEQVVAGKKYTYRVSFNPDSAGTGQTICTISLWYRAWLKDPNEANQYTIQCAEPNTIQKVETRDKRSADSVDEASGHKIKLLGAPTEIKGNELGEPEHHDRIKSGLKSYNDGSYGYFKIKKGTRQVVSGALYKYDIEAKPTAESKEKQDCSVEVWERLWLEGDEKRVYTVSCGEDEKKKRSSRSARPQPRHVDEYYSKGEEKIKAMFEKFKLKHNRKYHSSLEHDMRYRIFKNNLFKIDQLNKYEQGTAKYGVTDFADLTETEYRMRTGLIVPKDQERNHIRNPIADITDGPLPESYDWRDKGAVTHVKNQGSCGSCWAFSVTGNIEGLHAVKTGKLEEYSEQELLDCDTVDGACNGGYMDDAYKAIEKIGGLELESEYPYEAKKHKSCSFNKTMSHVQVSGAVDLPKDEVKMQQYLVANGPVSIALNANAMQFYRAGISHPWKMLCSHKNLDHGVLIVGYGIKEYPMFNKTLPYWVVKNSWGPKWGEQGYYRIYRGDNSCGVAEMATSAILADN